MQALSKRAPMARDIWAVSTLVVLALAWSSWHKGRPAESEQPGRDNRAEVVAHPVGPCLHSAPHLADNTKLPKLELVANFSMDDLQAAARLTGLLECTGTFGFTGTQLTGLWKSGADMTLSANHLACAAPPLGGRAQNLADSRCCQRTVHLRPNTTDGHVYRLVFQEHCFYFL